MLPRARSNVAALRRKLGRLDACEEVDDEMDADFAHLT